jgi:type II secretory pathway pseudopilin PulG
MVELLIAMTVMAIGLLAVFAMFESSILSITRASTTSTTSALADAEMENYRAIRHEVIGIDEADIAGVDGTYTGDSAYESNAADREHVLTCASNPAPCTDTLPTQNLIGADGKQYRVDTYIVNQQVNGGIGRDVKLVTIVVRDGSDPSKEWARVASSFDESTGF